MAKRQASRGPVLTFTRGTSVTSISQRGYHDAPRGMGSPQEHVAPALMTARRVVVQVAEVVERGVAAKLRQASMFLLARACGDRACVHTRSQPVCGEGEDEAGCYHIYLRGRAGEWCGGANNVCGGVEVSARVAEVPAKGLRVGAGGGLATY